METCLNCSETLTGRSDKIYCNPYCKSSYHYRINNEKEESMFKRIDKQLKLNRRLLKNYNKAGKSTIRSENLIAEGFNPKYFTHYWKNKKNDVYLFCFEYGFIERKENGRSKYVLVQWQSYMD
jgi:hypothetical protein